MIAYAAALLLAPFAAVPAQPAVADVITLADPSAVKIEGAVGEYIRLCEKNRLLVIDEDRLLRGFRHKPGEQAWIGEHVGKWLHAASLAWKYTHDPALKEKLDRVASGLLATQEADGYLGTYVPEKRFGLFPEADWDVWVHKYCLIGLLAYHEATGSAEALRGACRIGDLLLGTFGPGKKSIIAAGTHVGMAATSVLEPIVRLYFTTGEAKYLQFAKYIVSAYDEPNGPKIIQSLLAHGNVRKTANAKAYEMMSNLVGLCELYRATGEKTYLEVCEKAWQDIVEHRMYVTGGVSLGEHWQDDGVLPNGGAVSETCAQVTWLQLNLQLLRLTGDAKYGEVLEKIVLNHLLGAQSLDGAGFCYFTPLEGRKPYTTEINCCTSSGSRGIMLIPTFAFVVRGNEVLVNLKLSGEAELKLADGRTAKLRMYAANDRDQIAAGERLHDRIVDVEAHVDAAGAPLPLFVRSTTWLPGQGMGRSTWERRADKWFVQYPTLMLAGTGSNTGSVAVQSGHLVYCCERRFNPDLPPLVAFDDRAEPDFRCKIAPNGQILIEAKARLLKPWKDKKAGDTVVLNLSAFAPAGSDGEPIRVWLPRASSFDLAKLSLFAFGKETWSREGNQRGAIADNDPASFRVTFDGKPGTEDWFAVENDAPVKVARIVFTQGRLFHDGGWFDTSSAKVRLQVKRAKDGAWETVATLDAYPATTATDAKTVREGQRFEARLASPVEAIAVRVIGTPSAGDNPAQAFASCAELEGFAD